MLRICTELLQKTTCEQLLSFLIYNVTYRHEDRQKETNRRGSFNIIHIYKSGQKSNFQWREFRGIFFGHLYIFRYIFAVKIGLLSKMSRFMSIFTGLFYNIRLSMILSRKFQLFKETIIIKPKRRKSLKGKITIYFGACRKYFSC